MTNIPRQRRIIGRIFQCSTAHNTLGSVIFEGETTYRRNLNQIKISEIREGIVYSIGDLIHFNTLLKLTTGGK